MTKYKVDTIVPATITSDTARQIAYEYLSHHIDQLVSEPLPKGVSFGMISKIDKDGNIYHEELTSYHRGDYEDVKTGHVATPAQREIFSLLQKLKRAVK